MENKKECKDESFWTLKNSLGLVLILGLGLCYVMGGIFKVISSILISIVAVVYLFNTLRKKDIELGNPLFGKFKIKHLIVAVISYAVYIVLLSLSVGLFGESINNNGGNQTFIDGLVKDGVFSMVIMLLGSVIIAPVAEEVIFRRGVLGNPITYSNGQWKNKIGTIIAGTVLFATLHVIPEFIGLMDIGLSGIPVLLKTLYPYLLLSSILTFVYLRFKTLWVTVLLHFINNGIAMFITVFSYYS